MKQSYRVNKGMQNACRMTCIQSLLVSQIVELCKIDL